jgi:hypothetical protein
MNTNYNACQTIEPKAKLATRFKALPKPLQSLVRNKVYTLDFAEELVSLWKLTPQQRAEKYLATEEKQLLPILSNACLQAMHEQWVSLTDLKESDLNNADLFFSEQGLAFFRAGLINAEIYRQAKSCKAKLLLTEAIFNLLQTKQITFSELMALPDPVLAKIVQDPGLYALQQDTLTLALLTRISSQAYNSHNLDLLFDTPQGINFLSENCHELTRLLTMHPGLLHTQMLETRLQAPIVGSQRHSSIRKLTSWCCLFSCQRDDEAEDEHIEYIPYQRLNQPDHRVKKL